MSRKEEVYIHFLSALIVHGGASTAKKKWREKEREIGMERRRECLEMYISLTRTETNLARKGKGHIESREVGTLWSRK